MFKRLLSILNLSSEVKETRSFFNFVSKWPVTSRITINVITLTSDECKSHLTSDYTKWVFWYCANPYSKNTIRGSIYSDLHTTLLVSCDILKEPRQVVSSTLDMWPSYRGALLQHWDEVNNLSGMRDDDVNTTLKL